MTDDSVNDTRRQRPTSRHKMTEQTPGAPSDERIGGLEADRSNLTRSDNEWICEQIDTLDSRIAAVEEEVPGLRAARSTPAARCCGCDFADRTDHDRMLGLVDDPAVLRDVIKDVAQWDESDPERLSRVGLYELEKFVGQHNWSDPVAAYWLAIHVQDILEAVRRLDENERRRLEAVSA